MATRKPTEPPAADISALLNKVNELAAKASIAPLGAGAMALSKWKRWVGGEKPDYDVNGLRDIVRTDAIYLDNVEEALLSHIAADQSRHTSINTRLAALEAQPSGSPLFPFEG